ncbi:hypothetical protein ACFC08_18045 [Streptomyces sp. NPDC056112]|uniref:hypothetical protein n=1 Tax=Streptomyces sp. NPDC056112 TaxID=3345715 RepID=UPI0035E37C70
MRTLADHFRTIDALHALATEYPLLPAPDMRTTSDMPGDLLVSVMNLDGFEQWREALHVDADSIEYELTSLGQARLVAETRFAGATVLLHGYGPTPSQRKAQAA